MKKLTITLIVALIGISAKSFGQKLEENEFDKVMNKNVKQTSWETLASNSFVNAHYCFSLIGDDESFKLKLMRDKVFAINENQELIFKLDNGDTIKLANLMHAITCTGCGAVGFAGSGAEGLQVTYPLNKDQITKLKAQKVIAVSIFTVTDSFDIDIKEKNATKLQAALNLL